MSPPRPPQARPGWERRSPATAADRMPVAGRNYTVANVEKGLLEVQRMSCAGMALSCQLKVHGCLWTATEVSAQHRGPAPRTQGGVRK